MEARKSESSKSGVRREASCQVRLDRLVVGIPESEKGGGLPEPKGFRVTGDTWVRPQGNIATYKRVRWLRSDTNSCRASIQYQRQAPWLPACRLTLSGDDESGLTLDEVKAFLANSPDHKLSLVELAFDFHPDTLIDEEFVLCHGRFGKSRRETNRGGPSALRYGSRGSPKMVRCYWKETIGRYRVELELHSGMLRKLSLANIADLPRIASKLCPAHIQFKTVRWEKLESHLIRKYGAAEGRRRCAKARRLADISSRRVNSFLSRTVNNPHRFWVSESTTREIREALKRWAQQFSDSMDDL